MTTNFYLVPALLDIYSMCFKWCHFQIAHYNSAQDDFGTELAISTRTGLEPGNYYIAVKIIHVMINFFGGHCCFSLNWSI